jgi:hypothetical protein
MRRFLADGEFHRQDRRGGRPLSKSRFSHATALSRRAAGNAFRHLRIFLLWDFYNKPVPALPKSYGAVAMLVVAASLIRRADCDTGARSGRRLI